MIDFGCDSTYTPIHTQLVIKHGQVDHIKIIYLHRLVGVYSIFLNIISRNLVLVTNHEKGNNLVWIVVNSAIHIIEIFYNKDQADALVSILHKYEKLTSKDSSTNTICVERCIDRLSGVIKRSDN